MAWILLNNLLSVFDKPMINNKVKAKFMSLSIDSTSKNPYIGLARCVIERIGNINCLGYYDISKLYILESNDLLNWKVKSDLKIKGIENSIKFFQKPLDKFIGLEDPDIITDKKNIKHIFYTIPFKTNISSKEKSFYNVNLGHATGKNLFNLKSKIIKFHNVPANINGFKEICPIPETDSSIKTILAEAIINSKNNIQDSAIAILRARNNFSDFDFIKIAHNPKNETKNWCKKDSSPCRIINPEILMYKKYYIGIMNGREQKKNNKSGKFNFGLFLYDKELNSIVHVFNKPLYNFSNQITFASEIFYLKKNEILLYAHTDDSYIRVYKINISELKNLIIKEDFFK